MVLEFLEAYEKQSDEIFNEINSLLDNEIREIKGSFENKKKVSNALRGLDYRKIRKTIDEVQGIYLVAKKDVEQFNQFEMSFIKQLEEKFEKRLEVHTGIINTIN